MPTADFSAHERGLTEPFTFHPAEIIKLFHIGDQVKILAGKHQGLSGTIIAIAGNTAHLLTEDNKEELIVLLTDIKKGPARPLLSAQQRGRSHELAKHDLVMLNDARTVGIVLSLSADTVTLLDTENFVANHPKFKIANKFTKPANATNCFSQNIHSKCTVKVLAGFNKDALALVLNVYKNKVFLYDSNKTVNGGVFVEDANNCYVLESQVYDNSRNLARLNNPLLSGLQEQQAEGANGGQGAGPQANRNYRVALIGKQLKIIKGELKGYEGVIQSICDNKARFELSARNRVVSIPLDFLNLKEEDREAILSSGHNTARTPNHRPSGYSHYNPTTFATPAYNPDHYHG